LPKRIRGKRARLKQRPRSRYDLPQRYREQDLPTTDIGVAVIEDPYTQAGYLDAEGNLDASARLAPVQHSDGTVADGAPEWVPPRRPTMAVIRTFKTDPVGRMFARRQVDDAQYQAARAYQEAADKATLGSIRSVDWGRTKVSGGLPPDPLPEARQRAMRWLRVAEDAVVRRHGTEGLGLTRAVLVEPGF
jgi:hypothetical protein